jgi:23S rRNA pseudouridine2605 synthase
MADRLQKIIAHAGVASRRAAEELITQGRVEVNGKVVSELGSKADPSKDEIKVDGRRLPRTAPEHRYLLLYKPRQVISTRVDPQRRTTVIDLLTNAGVKGYFYPVGRLDYDSEGLMILTNDGDFAERVMHPRYELERAYEARVLGVPDAGDLERLERGIMLDGRRTLPAKVTVCGSRKAGDDHETTVEMVLREGRNRQVRSMFDAVGHPVSRLKRIRIGGLTDRGLKPGQIRDLTAEEVSGLTRAAVRKQTSGIRHQASGKGTQTTGNRHQASGRSHRSVTKRPATGSRRRAGNRQR